jgi:hypothetical protein
VAPLISGPGPDKRTALDHIDTDRSGQVWADALAIRELSEQVPVVAFVNNPFAEHDVRQ